MNEGKKKKHSVQFDVCITRRYNVSTIEIMIVYGYLVMFIASRTIFNTQLEVVMLYFSEYLLQLFCMLELTATLDCRFLVRDLI